jgi:uncharacterized protein
MSSPHTLSFIEATEARRSVRSLVPKTTVPDKEIVDLVRQALLVTPTAFSSQTVRATLLLHDDHAKLWTITGDALKAKIGQERYDATTKSKIEAFGQGYGTILFWDSGDAVENFRENCPKSYKDKVDEWVHHGMGICQYHLWVGLVAFGLGVNLQHYNPLIDEGVRKEWKLPADWQLRAQMVFGVAAPDVKLGPRGQKYPIEERFQAFGAQ